ncbi:unnamed protein product [Diabrotica balteata]|uniref:C2H2-type domain-containing protein n=1 Tax=Diabrotica balteata TaxID=107213 RepID=A0A9N9XI07_DIABA|nr:unnamed protein product [Diabrotica balteata]
MSNQDILICGNCRELFSELQELLEHKKTYCKLRFTCKCDSNKSKSPDDANTSASLLCVQCKDAFQNAWDLMVHAQAAHMLNIYELGVPSLGNCSLPSRSPRDNNTPDKLEKKLQLIPTTNNSSNSDKPIKLEQIERATEKDNLNEFVVKGQPDQNSELKPTAQKTIEFPKPNDSIVQNGNLENGKSECERRFEDLDTKWKTVGKSHRQKIQEIKEEFKSQVFRIKEKEKVSSIRKQKIQLIRDKYTQKLRKDREKYFLQLRKIKDERQRTLNEVCRKKPDGIQEYETALRKNEYLRQSPKLPKNLQRLVKSEFLGNDTDNCLDVYYMQQFKENCDFWKNKTTLNQIRKSPLYLENKIELSKESMENDFTCFSKNVEPSKISNIVNYKSIIPHLDIPPKPKKVYKSKLATKDRKKSNKLELFKTELSNLTISLRNQNSVNHSKDFLPIVNKSIDKMTENETSTSILIKFEDNSEKSKTDKASHLFKNVEKSDNENNAKIMLYKPEFSPLFSTKGKNKEKENASGISIKSRESNYVSSTQNSQSVIGKPNINKDQRFLKLEDRKTSFSKLTDKTTAWRDKMSTENLLPINNANIFKESTDTKFEEKSQIKKIPLRKILRSKKNEVVSKPFQSKSENFSPDDPIHLNQDQNELEEDSTTKSNPHTSELSLPRPNTFYEPKRTESELELTVENDLRWLIQEVPDKRDLYRILFGKKGMMVKKKEESMLEKQYTKSQGLPLLLSKNDPKVPKKVNVFKGKL